MYFRHSSYWHVKSGKWVNLGKEYSEALRKYASKEAGSGGMAGLIDRYLLEEAVNKQPKTQKDYRRMGEKLKPMFAEFSPEQVRPHHIAKIIDHEAKKHPVQANRYRQFLSAVFSHAVRWGLVHSNPCRDVKGISVKKRDRYITNEEFDAVKNASPQSVGCIMDFCYFTAQRISDVLNVKLSDISNNGVMFKQGKTGKKLLVQMTPELHEVIERAKSLHTKIRGMTLFHGRGGKQLSYFGVSSMFRRACKAAGVEDFHIHDIRAKALTDADRQGNNAQRLGGHANRSTTEGYIKLREIESATPPKRK